MTQKKKHDDFKVFRPTALNRILPFLMLGTITLNFMCSFSRLQPSLSDIDPALLSLIIIGLIIFSIAAFFWMYKSYHAILHDRIVLTPDGIDFIIQGTSGFAGWDLVDKLNIRGIHLSQPIDVSHNTLKRTLSFGRGYRRIPLSYIVDVPSTFRGRIKLAEFLATDFGRDLLQYAPHLFADDDSKAKRLAPDEDEQALGEERYVFADEHESRQR